MSSGTFAGYEFLKCEEILPGSTVKDQDLPRFNA